MLPAFPDARERERAVIRHPNRIGLLGRLSLDGFPLEEAVDRHQASTLGVSRLEHRRARHALCRRVDWLALWARLPHPERNEAPPQQVDLVLASLRMAPDHHEILRRCPVVARLPHSGIVGRSHRDLHAAEAGLDYATAHGLDVEAQGMMFNTS